MQWSLRIARVSGIDIRVHLSFLLIVAFFAVGGSQHGALGAAHGAATVLLLFTCVTLHELGHSLVAQRLGVPVKEILLLPIGGLARLGREPKTALHELLIAVAGPLVNIVLAVGLAASAYGLWGSLFFYGALDSLASGTPPSVQGLVGTLLAANVMLAVFNLLPALPMDGGRVLRALLSMLWGQARATRWAATIGQVLAAGMGLLGLYLGHLGLALVGAFVFYGAGRERWSSRSAEALAQLQAGEVVELEAPRLAPTDTLGEAVDRLLRSPHAAVAVTLGPQLLGVLHRDHLLAQIGRQGLGGIVAHAMQPVRHVVAATTPLHVVRAELNAADGAHVAVVGEEGLLGLLGPEDLGRIGALATGLARLGIQRPGVPAPLPVKD